VQAASQAALLTEWALRYLKMAIGAGYLTRERFESNPDLNGLRSRPGFTDLRSILVDRDFPVDPFARATEEIVPSGSRP
jgi:hypothetical protein